MEQIDELRGRLSALIEECRAIEAREPGVEAWRRCDIEPMRAEVEQLLAQWWAQGCREAPDWPPTREELRALGHISIPRAAFVDTIDVRVREWIERGDLVTADGRRAAGPRCPGCGADLRTTEVKSTNPEKCGACGAPVGPTFALEVHGARPGAIREG